MESSVSDIFSDSISHLSLFNLCDMEKIEQTNINNNTQNFNDSDLSFSYGTQNENVQLIDLTDISEDDQDTYTDYSEPSLSSLPSNHLKRRNPYVDDVEENQQEEQEQEEGQEEEKVNDILYESIFPPNKTFLH